MPDRVRLRADALEWRDVEGEIVALDLRRAEYLAVNRTGAALWPSLVDGATREELSELLVREYGRDRSAAAGDVDLFLGELDRQDLLEPG